MRKFLREKVVITDSKNHKGAFEVKYLRLEETVAVTSYRDDKIQTRVVDKWIQVNETIVFYNWKDVQKYLVDNVYKDQVFIQNMTSNYINFKLIEISCIGKYMK